AYRWLYEEANILHRDISQKSVMYRYGDHESVFGVLNGFDLAISTETPPSPGSQQHTGTAPFMAIDLLVESPPPLHLYRHGLESLYYVLVCTVCDTKHKSIQPWFNLRGSLLGNNKVTFLRRAVIPPRPGFEVFSKWIYPIHVAFAEGLSLQSKFWHERLTEPYTDETLGGCISFDEFEKIFNVKLVDRAAEKAAPELQDILLEIDC
ncbi:hypothetical protein DL96DRAFT_1476922, partial [Flagelloscypha sp. PMI_526]